MMKDWQGNKSKHDERTAATWVQRERERIRGWRRRKMLLGQLTLFLSFLSLSPAEEDFLALLLLCHPPPSQRTQNGRHELELP